MNLRGRRARVAIWALCGLFGGQLLGWVFTLAMPEMYTSRFTVQVTSSVIPQRYVPALQPITVEWLHRITFPYLLSRSYLENLMMTHGLFDGEPTGYVTEDAVQSVREKISIQDSGNQVKIAFSYKSAKVAQEVSRNLQTDLINASMRRRESDRETPTVRYLKLRADKAGAQWEELAQKARQAAPDAIRLQLDRDLARQRYETLHQQLDEAETASALDQEEMGSRLEVVDTPSWPDRPDPIWGLKRPVIIAFGGLAGLLIASAVALFRRKRAALGPSLVTMPAEGTPAEADLTGQGGPE